MTIDEQIANLKAIGLQIDDEDYARRIEINARCRIANYISEHYGVLGYKDKENFVSEEYHRQFLDDIKEEIRRNLRAPSIAR